MSAFGPVIPVLTYEDIPAAHDFLVQAFGFIPGGVHRTAEGQPVHGEVRAGDTAIWLHRVTAEHHLDSPRAADMANAGLVVFVDDVDAHFRTPAPRARRSTVSRSISRTASVSTVCAISRATDGGS